MYVIDGEVLSDSEYRQRMNKDIVTVHVSSNTNINKRSTKKRKTQLKEDLRKNISEVPLKQKTVKTRCPYCNKRFLVDIVFTHMNKCIKALSINSTLANVQKFLMLKKYPYIKTLLKLLEIHSDTRDVKAFCSAIDEKFELYHQCKENLQYLLIPSLPPVIQSQLDELLNKVAPTIQNGDGEPEKAPKITKVKTKYKNESHSTNPITELVTVKGGKQSFTPFTVEKSPVENQHELRESGKFGSMPLYDDMD